MGERGALCYTEDWGQTWQLGGPPRLQDVMRSVVLFLDVPVVALAFFSILLNACMSLRSTVCNPDLFSDICTCTVRRRERLFFNNEVLYFSHACTDRCNTESDPSGPEMPV